MPNINKKNHIQPKRNKMKASEFYMPYANSVEDINQAIKNATRFEEISREDYTRKVNALDKKYALNVANFWCEVRNHLLNYKEKLKTKK